MIQKYGAMNLDPAFYSGSICSWTSSLVRAPSDESPEVAQCPGNEGRAYGTGLPEVINDLICKSSFGGFVAFSDVKMVPLLNDFDVA